MVVNFISGHSILASHKTGVQIHDLNIIKSLLELGCDVRIYDLKRKKDYDYNELKMNNDKDILDRVIFSKYKQRYSRHLPFSLVFHGNIPQKNEIVILDSYFLKKCESKKYKTYSIVHDLMPYIYPNNYTNIKLYYKLLDKSASSDVILANSNATREDYIKYYPYAENKVKVLPCCIADNYKMILKEYLSAYNQKWSNKRYFYYIGDMRKNKNLNIAVEAFLKFLEKNNDYYFIIAGKKTIEYENLKKIIDFSKYKDKIIFTGYISEQEKSDLILNAFALLFISDYEGFGIPIIEAMACGVPVITSNCSSMKEIADGAAYLVNQKNVKDVVNAINHLVYNDLQRKEYIKKGIERARLYNHSAQKERLKEIFHF